MHGFDAIRAIDATVVVPCFAAAAYSSYVPIHGANTLFVKVATATSAHAIDFQLSDTTSASYPYFMLSTNGTGGGAGGDATLTRMRVPSGTHGCIYGIQNVAGMRYLRAKCDVDMTAGLSMSVYNIV